MDIRGRTVLIVGGTSGIGLGLARRFAAAGSDVIVGGRTTGAVDDFETITIDVSDPDSIRRARDEVLTKHQDLDVMVTMSGVMLVEDLRDPARLTDAETTISVNLLGTIRVIDAFTPHLLRQGRGDIVTVTSGIAFLPFPLMSTYAASKAGVHAYTERDRGESSLGVPVGGTRRHLRRTRRAPLPVPQHPAGTLTQPPAHRLGPRHRRAGPRGPGRQNRRPPHLTAAGPPRRRPRHPAEPGHHPWLRRARLAASHFLPRVTQESACVTNGRALSQPRCDDGP